MFGNEGLSQVRPNGRCVTSFSTNLKYLKRTTSNNHHKNRLKNDLRAFLVILIESFSVITISWDPVGSGKSWHIKQNPLLSPSQQMELQISNDASINYNYSIYSRPENYRHSELTSSIQIKKFKQTLSKKQKNVLDNDDSLNISKNEDEQNINDQNELELFNKNQLINKYKKPQIIKTFFIDKIHFFGSKKNIQIRKQQTKLNTIEQTKKRKKN
ncbi:unnamed protein product [Rotaria sp. Silwood1]|nr:unnamed protein product [Rotaria sp. Silwood1]CAF1658534.1 unnamed protein product [Rotaria sp. Silwood1]